MVYNIFKVSFAILFSFCGLTLALSVKGTVKRRVRKYAFDELVIRGNKKK